MTLVKAAAMRQEQGRGGGSIGGVGGGGGGGGGGGAGGSDGRSATILSLSLTVVAKTSSPTATAVNDDGHHRR